MSAITPLASSSTWTSAPSGAGPTSAAATRHAGPSDLIRLLPAGEWGLDRARQTARAIGPPQLRGLMRLLLGDVAETRKRAADVARRITEFDPHALAPHADVLADILAELPAHESRTRWHLGLAVARVAPTRPQRLRAARILALLAEDDSNVVRCSAVEGLALLAAEEPDLRPEAEELIARFLHSEMPAIRCRARHAARLLARVQASSSSRSAST